jgi:hypothetical protein
MGHTIVLLAYHVVFSTKGRIAFINAQKYIAKQEEHHRKISFQEEFLSFLKQHKIRYDEKYIWE